MANVYVANGTPNENVALTVTNNGYGSQAFNNGGGATSPTSTPVNAMIYNPQNPLPEITVVGWINPKAPDLASISKVGVNTNLLSELTPGSAACTALIGSWYASKIAWDVNNTIDRNYANLWLLANSANPQPPLTTLPPGFQNNISNYRLFGDWQGQPTQDGASQRIGGTIDPCKIFSATQGDNSGNMGYYQKPTTQGNIYRVYEGRAGEVAQGGYFTINIRTLPFIYGIVGYTASGALIPLIHTGFPTFYVYKNGTYLTQFPQSGALQFLNGSDATNENQWMPLP